MSPRDLVYVGHMLHLGVDEDIVWQVVTQDLPTLVAALEPLVKLPPSDV